MYSSADARGKKSFEVKFPEEKYLAGQVAEEKNE
jgi:hypothetical protein